MVRFELFYKDERHLRQTLQQYSQILKPAGDGGARSFQPWKLNIPNKGTLKGDFLHSSVRIIGDEAEKLGKLAGGRASFNLVPHYSFNYEYEKNPQVSFDRFERFLDLCEDVNARSVRDGSGAAVVDEVLLVSGSKKKALDTVKALDLLAAERSSRKSRRIRFGVAFNPYFPQKVDQDAEYRRMELKLQTGMVSSVWLQFGTDLSKLESSLQWLSALAASSSTATGSSIRLYGSVFIPSPKFLAQFKFRPWNGVFCSEKYLSDVASARDITRDMLKIYRRFGVEPLVESSCVTDKEVSAFLDLFSGTDFGNDGEDDSIGGEGSGVSRSDCATAPPRGTRRLSENDRDGTCGQQTKKRRHCDEGSSGGGSLGRAPDEAAIRCPAIIDSESLSPSIAPRPELLELLPNDARFETFSPSLLACALFLISLICPRVCHNHMFKVVQGASEPLMHT